MCGRKHINSTIKHDTRVRNKTANYYTLSSSEQEEQNFTPIALFKIAHFYFDFILCGCSDRAMICLSGLIISQRYFLQSF